MRLGRLNVPGCSQSTLPQPKGHSDGFCASRRAFRCTRSSSVTPTQEEATNMSTSSIVRIACNHKGRQQFWTVQQGGAVKLGDASQAQLFVCRCEEAADRSCFIQHLQSGAFIEQGEHRNLQLALSAASAAVFSKLRAYSEGKRLRVACAGPFSAASKCTFPHDLPATTSCALSCREGDCSQRLGLVEGCCRWHCLR